MSEAERSYTVADALAALGDSAVSVVGDNAATFSRPVKFADAQAGSLTFYKGRGPDSLAVLAAASASVVVTAEAPAEVPRGRAFLVVADPRKAFVRIVGRLFQPAPRRGVHPSAVIDPGADIDPSAYVGANAVIGKCTIGAGTVIHANVTLYDGVRVGDRVVVNAGTVVGADGFGYERAEDGSMEKFLHLGGVLIEDDVEIGSNTSIDRGTLGDTHIRRGAKIDNQVHVAHNCDVGEDAVIIAESMIGGSVRIGARAWIAPSSVLMNGISIGADAVCGLGCVVTKSVGDGETVLGNPARPIAEAKALLAAQKKLIAG